MHHQDNFDSVTERPVASIASGCLYAVYVVSLSAGLLFLNALFCLYLYGALPKLDNEQFQARLGQLFYFTVPLLMLILEWHVLDRLQRLFRLGAR